METEDLYAAIAELFLAARDEIAEAKPLALQLGEREAKFALEWIGDLLGDCDEAIAGLRGDDVAPSPRRDGEKTSSVRPSAGTDVEEVYKPIAEQLESACDHIRHARPLAEKLIATAPSRRIRQEAALVPQLIEAVVKDLEELIAGCREDGVARSGRRDATPRPATDFAELDPLARLVQAAIVQLEAEGRLSPEEWGSPPPRFNGYCARGCRAYRCLVRSWPEARAFSWYPEARIRRDPDSIHFWLVPSANRVLDLNFADGEDPGNDFDYDDSESGEGFHRKRGDGRYPARLDAQLIMDTVLEYIRKGV